jgi:curved DNA-binding protein CbpA
MTDYFVLLGEPRRPWLDPEALKTRFLTLSAATHPDRFHHAPAAKQEAATRQSAELNTAHSTLRDPKTRLLHLLELELGRRPTGIEQAPPGLMDLFLEVGGLCQEADRFRAERDRITSPMLKAKAFAQGLELTDRLGQLQEQVRVRLAALESELSLLNAAWETAPPVGSPERAARLPLERLADLARSWSFAARWLGQLQERVVHLAV